MVESQITPHPMREYDSPAVEIWHEYYVPIANALLNAPPLRLETIDANPEFMVKVREARAIEQGLAADPDFPTELAHPQAVYSVAYRLYMRDASETRYRPSDIEKQLITGILHRAPEELVAEHAHAEARLDRSNE